MVENWVVVRGEFEGKIIFNFMVGDVMCFYYDDIYLKERKYL